MPTPAVGEPAPSFAEPLPDAEGNTTRVLTEQPTVLAIYKSSCAASKAMLPMVQRFHEAHAESPLRVIGVAQDSANITRSFARRYGITFPIIVEGQDFPVSNGFDIATTPTVFVIDSSGRVVYSTMGFLRPQVDEIEAAIASQLGEPPQVIFQPSDADIPMFVPG